MPVDMAALERKQLVRRGYLVPAFSLDGNRPTHKIDPLSETEFTFSNALQAERLRQRLPDRGRLEELPFETPVDLVLFLLPMMPTRLH
jgi:hypothetical protein